MRGMLRSEGEGTYQTELSMREDMKGYTHISPKNWDGGSPCPRCLKVVERKKRERAAALGWFGRLLERLTGRAGGSG